MKILVPLDGSSAAEAAVPVALEFARGENVGLVLLMVTNAHPLPDPAPCEPDVAPIREAQSYLDMATHHARLGLSRRLHCSVARCAGRRNHARRRGIWRRSDRHDVARAVG